MKKVLLLILLFLPLFGEVGFVEPWGKDATLSQKKVHKTFSRKKTGVMIKLSESVIAFHQNILSPVDGPRSHYRPSSSNYMLFSIRQHGFIKGYLMGCDRLLRENKEEWVYRKVVDEGSEFKWDPVSSSKRRSSSKNSPS